MNYETELAFLGSTDTILTKLAYPNINWVGSIMNADKEVGIFRTTMEAYADDFDLADSSKPIRIARYIASHYKHLDIDRIDIRNQDIHFSYYVINEKEVKLLNIYQEYKEI